jgi:hypothetical protein
MLTAYDVVQRLRPSWIAPRGYLPTGRLDVPDVYVNGVRYGSCEMLRSIKTTEMAELRFLDNVTATALFSSADRLILVTLRR